MLLRRAEFTAEALLGRLVGAKSLGHSPCPITAEVEDDPGQSRVPSACEPP